MGLGTIPAQLLGRQGSCLGSFLLGSLVPGCCGLCRLLHVCLRHVTRSAPEAGENMTFCETTLAKKVPQCSAEGQQMAQAAEGEPHPGCRQLSLRVCQHGSMLLAGGLAGHCMLCHQAVALVCQSLLIAIRQVATHVLWLSCLRRCKAASRTAT